MVCTIRCVIGVCFVARASGRKLPLFCTSEIGMLTTLYSFQSLISTGSAASSSLSHQKNLSLRKIWKANPRRHHRCRRWKKSRAKKIQVRSQTDPSSSPLSIALSSTHWSQRQFEPDVSRRVGVCTCRLKIIISRHMRPTSWHTISRRAMRMMPRRWMNRKV